MSKTSESGTKIDPMHQFEVHSLIELPSLFGYNISFTNASLFMVLAVFLSGLFLCLSARQAKIIPSRLQLLGEECYQFIANMVEQNAGREAMIYFPFVFTIFMFVLFANMLGMVPYGFTVTSHIIITFALAMIVFLLVTIIGFIKHGVSFLRLFVPKGVPVALLPLLIVIELISYLSRPISLSVRLFANMLAGHTMMKVFAGFCVAFLSTKSILALGVAAPLLIMFAFTGLEIVIAFLQAYVFAVLTCIYLNDALNLH